MDRASAAKKQGLPTPDQKSVVDSAHVPANTTVADEQPGVIEEAATAVSVSPEAAIDNKVSILKLLSYSRMWGALILTFASAIVLGSIEVKPTSTEQDALFVIRLYPLLMHTFYFFYLFNLSCFSFSSPATPFILYSLLSLL